MDKYDLYEWCVTDAVRLVPFLRAVHGREPRVLREDFSGTGALARGWAGLVEGGRAIAVDRDADVLARAKAEGVITRCIDAAKARDKADVIAATNFAVGYWHTRAALVAYLRGVRASLRARGVFVCDLYGGRTATRAPHEVRRRLRGPDGQRIEHVWEQRTFDPQTHLVRDVLHFAITPPRTGKRKGRRPRVLRDAFVYDWRLWSIPELREAMHEAGLRSVRIYDRLADAMDAEGTMYVRPVPPGEALDEDWVVYVVGER